MEHRLCQCGSISTYDLWGVRRCYLESASSRELRFKRAVLRVVDSGEHPSGVRIRRVLKKLRFPTDGNLGGDETRWRREILMDLGWTRPASNDPSGIRGRWKPPET